MEVVPGRAAATPPASGKWPPLAGTALKSGVERIAEHVLIERSLEFGLPLDFLDRSPGGLAGPCTGVDGRLDHWHIDQVVRLVQGDEHRGNFRDVPRDF